MENLTEKQIQLLKDMYYSGKDDLNNSEPDTYEEGYFNCISAVMNVLGIEVENDD